MLKLGRGENLLAVASVAAMSVFGASGAAAQGLALGQEKAEILRNTSDLSAARGANARERVQSLLAARGKDRATQRSIELLSVHPGVNGASFARFEQRIDGLRVHGGYAKAAFNADGELIHFIERLAPAGGRIGRPTLGDAEALRIAIDQTFGASVSTPGLARKEGAVATFADDDFFFKGPSVERVIISRGGTLEEGFLVETWSDAGNLLYHTVVDGVGRVVSSELRTAEDSYNIFPDHPGVTNQTIVSGPGAGNAQSPNGWLSGSQTSLVIQGNNVSAYLDRDANNSPDGGGVSVTDGNFLAVANLGQEPTTFQNQEVAVQNLFYFNNVIHDTLYTHGFVESVGNFQVDNFGNGGNGGDPVLAEAQDGSGTNNANFATPSDGSSGRMQMYLWTTTSPGRDGDVDSDIIWHEYGHGLTWRMIGSMSGAVSGAIGEGMSDVLSIIQNDNDVVGEYSTNDPLGIRSEAYTGYSRTIGDFSGSSVHFDGEIYAATIWFLKSLYSNDDQLMTDLVQGMNFTPSGPDYMEMRDGIISAVNARSGDNCPVWEAFANFGMGEGSAMDVRSRGPFNSRVTVTESFSVPSSCSGGGNNPPTASFDDSCTDLTCSFTDQSSDNDGSIVSWAWNFGDGGTSSSQNPSHTYSADGTYTVELTVTDDDGAAATTSTTVTVSDGGDPGGDFTLASSGFKVRGVHHIDLNWSGSAGGQVDVYRNGSLVATVGGSSYTDNTGAKGGGATYSHQVCDAGTSTCSNTTTTSF
jgi:hypothetical protein